jgi:hypothetical protein
VSRRSRRAPLAEVHDISRARLVQGLKAMHAPFDVFTECGHQHSESDTRARHVEGLGMVCDDGLVTTVCLHCCVADHAQAAVCETRHDHEPDRAVCPTMALVTGFDPPWKP